MSLRKCYICQETRKFAGQGCFKCGGVGFYEDNSIIANLLLLCTLMVAIFIFFPPVLIITDAYWRDQCKEKPTLFVCYIFQGKQDAEN